MGPSVLRLHALSGARSLARSLAHSLVAPLSPPSLSRTLCPPPSSSSSHHSSASAWLVAISRCRHLDRPRRPTDGKRGKLAAAADNEKGKAVWVILCAPNKKANVPSNGLCQVILVTCFMVKEYASTRKKIFWTSAWHEEQYHKNRSCLLLLSLFMVEELLCQTLSSKPKKYCIIGQLNL